MLKIIFFRLKNCPEISALLMILDRLFHFYLFYTRFIFFFECTSLRSLLFNNNLFPFSRAVQQLYASSIHVHLCTYRYTVCTVHRDGRLLRNSRLQLICMIRLGIQPMVLFVSKKKRYFFVSQNISFEKKKVEEKNKIIIFSPLIQASIKSSRERYFS